MNDNSDSLNHAFALTPDPTDCDFQRQPHSLPPAAPIRYAARPVRFGRRGEEKDFLSFFFFLTLSRSDFKQLMGLIETRVRDAGRWSDVQTLENAVAMYEHGKDAVVLPSVSRDGYARRGASLAWTTVFKVLSENRRLGKSGKGGRKKRERPVESESSSDDDEIDEVQVDEEEVAPAHAPKRASAASAQQPPKKRHSAKD